MTAFDSDRLMHSISSVVRARKPALSETHGAPLERVPVLPPISDPRSSSSVSNPTMAAVRDRQRELLRWRQHRYHHESFLRRQNTQRAVLFTFLLLAGISYGLMQASWLKHLFTAHQRVFG